MIRDVDALSDEFEAYVSNSISKINAVTFKYIEPTLENRDKFFKLSQDKYNGEEGKWSRQECYDYAWSVMMEETMQNLV